MLTAPLSEQSTEVSNESDILLPPSSTDAAANSRNAEDVIFPEQAVHGQHISWASAYILIVSRMMGSGVFASPGVVMQSAGSIGLSLCVWIFGAFMAGCGAAVSLEYGCMLPRSGGEKVYLEYVYRRPRFLMSTLIAVKTVLQTATVNNCIIFGEYFVYGLPIAPSVTARKLSAIGLLLCTGILHGLFLKTGILIQNTLGWLKICLMICLALTAMYVLAAGLVKGPGPPILLSAASDHESIWNVIWKGSRWSWDLVALALFRVYYAYAGLDNANMALNEVQDPVGMLRRVVPMALFSVTSLYLLINCAFFLVLPSETFKEQGEMAAVAFFVHVLGHRMGTIVFPLLIAFCVVGNVMVGMFSLSRLNQEIARQGFLPLVFASSPLGGIIVNFVPTALYILLLPSSNIYAFLLEIDAYATQFFAIALACGLIWLRWARADLLRPLKAWRSIIIVNLGICLALTTAPFFSSRSASEEYLGLPRGVYALFGICIIFGATLYWLLWAKLMPFIRGQTLKEQNGVLPNGSTYTAIVGIPRQ